MDPKYQCGKRQFVKLINARKYADKVARETNVFLAIEEIKRYVFLSFASLQTKRNIGCCIVQVADENEAFLRCKDLGIIPDGPTSVLTVPMTEIQFQSEGMELDRFYSREEMIQKGYTTTKVTVRM